MPDFIPGLELARLLYVEGVRPILDADWPGLAHGAALLGPGSEVLGFDDATSTDHGWGPRLQVFLAEADHTRHADAIRAALGQALAAHPARLSGGLPAAHAGRTRHLHAGLRRAGGDDPPPGGGRDRARLRGRDPGLRPRRSPHARRLAELPGPKAAQSDRRGRLPRRRRVGRSARAAGLVSARRVAVPAGGGLGAHRPGGAPAWAAPGSSGTRSDRR